MRGSHTSTTRTDGLKFQGSDKLKNLKTAVPVRVLLYIFAPLGACQEQMKNELNKILLILVIKAA